LKPDYATAIIKLSRSEVIKTNKKPLLMPSDRISKAFIQHLAVGPEEENCPVIEGNIKLFVINTKFLKLSVKKAKL